MSPNEVENKETAALVIKNIENKKAIKQKKKVININYTIEIKWWIFNGILSICSECLLTYYESLNHHDIGTISHHNTNFIYVLLINFLIGMIFKGYFGCIWYKYLDYLCTFSSTTTTTPSSLVETIAKVSFDQIMYTPIANLIYYYLIGYAYGYSLSMIHHNIQTTYINLMYYNYLIWPFINIFTFHF